jgi:type IV pilus assembly protein PilX
LDLQGGLTSSKSRSHIFLRDSREGFIEGCGSGYGNIYLGLCATAVPGATPVWLEVNFMDESGNARTVPYGFFTGQSFQVGQGSLPARLPRYIIENMLYTGAGESATDTTYFYRITAIGFGSSDTSQVVLQTFYRKDGA